MIEYKEYQIKVSKEFPNCVLVVTAGRGGKIPDVLSGLFTSPSVAKVAIDTYLELKGRKD